MAETELPTAVTSADIQALYYILECAWSSCKVAYATDYSGQNILYGTARNMVGGNSDVRSQSLRITDKIGIEHHVPVLDIMKVFHEGGFAKFDW